jgi:hypothetical protein
VSAGEAAADPVQLDIAIESFVGNAVIEVGGIDFLWRGCLEHGGISGSQAAKA